MTQKTAKKTLPKEHTRRRMLKQFGVVGQYFLAIIVTLIALFPLYWMFISSFKTTEELLLSRPTFWPQNFYTAAYGRALQKYPLGRYMINSLIVTIACTSIQVIIGVLAAYAFSKGEFPGKDVLFVLILGALMIPIQVTFIPTYLMIAHWGWINTYVGMIVPEAVSAYFIFMLRQNFKAVDDSYLDAGRVDGMGRIGIIVHVLVPMNKPTIVTVTVISLINGWNSYFWPKMIITTDSLRPVSIALREMFRSVAPNEILVYNEIMAAALMCIIPVAVLFFLCQKYILTGFSKAAMK